MTASLTGGASRPPTRATARATARDAVVPFGPADVGSSVRSGGRAPALVPTTAPTAPTATTASPWQPGRSTRPGMSSTPNPSLEDPPR
jgi:hypothetical protein